MRIMKCMYDVDCGNTCYNLAYVSDDRRERREPIKGIFRR